MADPLEVTINVIADPALIRLEWDSGGSDLGFSAHAGDAFDLKFLVFNDGGQPQDVHLGLTLEQGAGDTEFSTDWDWQTVDPNGSSENYLHVTVHESQVPGDIVRFVIIQTPPPAPE